MIKRTLFGTFTTLEELSYGGFVVNGAEPYDRSGSSVVGVGDVDGDGIDDLLIGAPGNEAGLVYLLYGTAADRPSNLDLADLTASDGFVIRSTESLGRIGWSLGAVGDVNGDGLADFLVGAPSADAPGRESAGSVYIVFGSTGSVPDGLELGDLDGSNGFAVRGPEERTSIGSASVGDLNGDGFDDLLFSVPSADAPGRRDAGSVYVVFGRAAGFAGEVDLAALESSSGFILQGLDQNAQIAGRIVGDVNGDGLSDLVITAPGVSWDPSRQSKAYVIYGTPLGGSPPEQLDALNGLNGFVIEDSSPDRRFYSVTSAGDLNGDGRADLLVLGSRDDRAHIVYRHEASPAASVDLATLGGANGFTLLGAGLVDSGAVLAKAGDFNGDGLDDLVIGAPGTGAGTGRVFVVFGRSDGFAATVDLESLDGSNGFAIAGANAGDQLGISVSSAGDLNNDGIADLLLNGSSEDRSYVVFGQAGSFAPLLRLRYLDGEDAFGFATGDYANAVPAGDVNGDGIDDLVVGLPSAGTTGEESSSQGRTYIIYGRTPAAPSAIDDAVATTRDRPVTIRVLDNDAEVDGAPALARGPVHGRAYLTRHGEFIYRPDAGFTGTDSFTYEVRGLSGPPAEATVSLTVGPPPNPPIVGTVGNDGRNGTAGDDHISGGAGQDRLFGGRGDDVLLGGTGDDRLNGGDGQDVLVGGPGQETLEGGGGSDLFVLDGSLGTDIVREAVRYWADRILLDVPELQLADGSLDGARVDLVVQGRNLAVQIDPEGDGTFRTIAQVEGVAGALPEDVLVNALTDFGQTSRTITVTTRGDVVDPSDGLVSLREAIAFSELSLAADTITFAADLVTLGGIAITLGDELLITQAGGGLTIDGDVDNDGRPDVLLQGSGDHRILRIENDGEPGSLAVTLDGLTITGGVAERVGGGIAAYGADLTVRHSVIRSNRAGTAEYGDGETPAFGGGLYLSDGKLIIDSSEIVDNRVGSFEWQVTGGGVFVRNAIFQLADSVVSNNVALSGAYYGSGDGGGIATRDTTLSIVQSVFEDNRAGQGYDEPGFGGGLLIEGGSFTISGSTFQNNSAASGGGGIATSASGTVSESRLSENRASDGGGIWSGYGVLTVTDSLIDENAAFGGGRRYQSPGSGGGINAAELVLTNSTITGNRTNSGDSAGNGGGIAAGSATIVNSTIVFNYAGAHSGWYTISSAPGKGGIAAGTLTLSNSIVAGNTGGVHELDEPVTYDIAGELISNGHNIFSQLTLSGTAPTDRFVDAATLLGTLLGELADNGGPTPTHALLPNSVAVDAGSDADAIDPAGQPLSTDQRGQPRMLGEAVDIGAFEAVDTVPIAAADAATTTLVRPVLIDVLANDTLFTGGTGIAASPAHGHVWRLADDRFLYLPDGSFIGQDSFAYELTDRNGDGAGATVTVTVGPAPVPPVRGTAAGELLGGGAGDDLVLGQGGDDRLFGKAGADLLLGGKGADFLAGGPGDDILIGGLGHDIFAPAAGADLIVLAGETGIDTVRSFDSPAGDRVLIDIAALRLTDGSLDGTKLRLETVGRDLALLVDPEGDGSFRKLAVLENAAGLTADQVLVNALEGYGQDSAVILVTTATDVVNATDGLVSLREALALAESTPAADRITFDPTIFTPGAATILLQAGELLLGETGGPVMIDGDLDDDGRADVTLDAGGLSRVMRIANSVALGVPEVALDGLVITGGYDLRAGGGIASDLASLTITHSRIEGNRVGTEGIFSGIAGAGGGINVQGGSLTIRSSIVANNQASAPRYQPASGGGLYGKDASVTITDSLIVSNDAVEDGEGGGLALIGSSLTLLDTTVADSGEPVYGSTTAISLQSSTALIRGSRITGNAGTGIGSEESTLEIEATTIDGNGTWSQYPAASGGVRGRGGVIAISNSTISKNVGIGVDIGYTDSVVTIVNSTIVGNGGGLSNDYTNVLLHNSIVAGNNGDEEAGPGADVTGPITSNGHNIFSQADIAGALAGDVVVDPAIVLGALLGPLASNGGPTPTHVPLPGSPAINAGANADAVDQNGLPLGTDQRGQPRIVGAAVDIGAVESGPVAPVLAINAGGPAFTAADGTRFEADRGFVGGLIASRVLPIAGTLDDALFHNERWGPTGFGYDLDVANGDYVLTLRFAETFFEAGGKRIFDVAVEGQERISDLDVFARVGGDTALDITLPVTISDGRLDLDFLKQTGSPILDALKLVPVAQPVDFAVNVGGPAYRAADGTAYRADTGFTGGNVATRAVPIEGTIDDELYHNERWSPSGFAYDLELDAGWYLVRLQFAETFFAAAGKRIFDVALEGQVRLDDLDITARVGKGSALDLTLAVEVIDGQLDLELLPVLGSPILDAFRVTSLGPFDIA